MEVFLLICLVLFGLFSLAGVSMLVAVAFQKDLGRSAELLIWGLQLILISWVFIAVGLASIPVFIVFGG